MEGPPLAKRLRLSMACNECRRRKVKCDADYPKCRNCRLRDGTCTTTDPKRPETLVMREWLEQQTSVEVNSSTSLTDRNQTEKTVAQQSLDATQVASPPNDDLGSNQNNGTIGISPVHQPYEMAFNMDRLTNRMKMMGGSSSQCLTKTLDVYLRSSKMKPLSSNFRHGMRHSEEMEIPLVLSLPALPEANTRNRYLNAFFTRIHVLFPIYDVDESKNTVHQLASVPDFHSLTREQIPLLTSAYLIMSMGADEEAMQLTDDGEKYLQAAASLMGHIILIPYLPAVQALLLFTMNYRGRNRDGVGWQTLGIAIRIAHTLGLHRHSAVQPSSQHGVQQKREQLFHARIWAVCCCLEKIMQLESGRPSVIDAVDCDQMMGRDQRAPGHDFLQWQMGLAEYQGEISQHIYGQKPVSRTARQLLLETARLDRSLLSWANQIPSEFRPGNDLFCSNHEFHIAAFISLQYHQTMIALHRAALVAPIASFEMEVARQCSHDPSHFRLKGGASICVNSARSIAKCTIELSERKAESRIITAGPALLACVVLGIYLLKYPGSRMQAADLELLKVCAHFTTDQYLKTGMDARFSKGAIAIYDHVRSHLDLQSQKKLKKQNPSNPQRIVDSQLSKQPNPPNPEGRRSESHPVGPPAYQDAAHSYPAQQYSETFQGLNSATNWVSHQEPMPSYDRVSESGQSLQTPDAGYESSNNIEVPPFDGLNVEDLWNWMLVMDSDVGPEGSKWYADTSNT